MSRGQHPPHSCADCGSPTWGKLCASCHKKKFEKEYPRTALTDTSINHGTRWAYEKGCRCQPCTTVATMRRSARKKQKRQREYHEKMRLTTIEVSWEEGVTRERAQEISRRVAREISKFKGVEEAYVAGTPSERVKGELVVPEGLRPRKGIPRRDSQSPPVSRSERVSGNGELDLSKVPSFKSRGKGKSLVEVVEQLTERS